MTDLKTESVINFDSSLLDGDKLDVQECFKGRPKRPVVVYDTLEKHVAAVIYTSDETAYVRVWDGGKSRFGPMYFSNVHVVDGELRINNSYYSQYVSIPLERAEARPLRFATLVNDEPNRGQLNAYQSVGSSAYMDDLTSQLHDIANNNDWCSEFDDLMEQIGLETRSKDYVTTVRATAEISLEAGERVSEAIGWEIGDESYVGTVQATIETTVRVYWTGRSGEEDSYVDNNEIEEALENQLHSVDINEVVSWDILDTETVD